MKNNLPHDDTLMINFLPEAFEVNARHLDQKRLFLRRLFWAYSFILPGLFAMIFILNVLSYPIKFASATGVVVIALAWVLAIRYLDISTILTDRAKLVSLAQKYNRDIPEN